MPFVDTEEEVKPSVFQFPDESGKDDPNAGPGNSIGSFFTGAATAFAPALRQMNSVVSGFNAMRGMGGQDIAEPGYDPFTDIDGYEEDARAFIGAQSRAETARIKTIVDGERKDKETIAASGWSGIAASFAAGALDPTLLIPVGGQLRAGESALTTALKTARTAALSMTAQETLLQASQRTRTLEESATNIAAGTLFSGILGGAVGAVRAGGYAARAEGEMRIPVGNDPLEPGFVKITPAELAEDTTGLSAFQRDEHGRIVEEEVARLRAAGVPEEEIPHIAALTASRNVARASRLEGETPYELYKRERPEIQVDSGQAAPIGEGEFAQSQDKGPVFYSALTHGVESLKQERAPAEQWVNTIKNLPGVKQEEIEWSGVKEWLAEQKGPVTKSDLQDFLRSNEVNVQEVEKGGSPEARDALSQEWYGAPFRDLPPSQASRIEDEFSRGQRSTKFGQYTLPGGENYRELLLTLPTESKLEKRQAELVSQIRALQSARKRNEITREEFSKYWAILDGERSRLALLPDPKQKPFVDPHWRMENVLAHVRFDDRTGQNGERILHVAEIQSDWHQRGRKQGYADPRAVKRIGEIRAERERISRETDAMEHNGVTRSDLTKEQREKYNSLIAQRGALDNEARTLDTARAGVPDAPFKTTWQELAMKRMLRYAAENGYDRLSWDTGETQASRYDLSQQIDALEIRNDMGGNRTVEVFKNRNRIFQVEYDPKTGNVVSAPNGMEGKHISDIFGKDAADKIMALPEKHGAVVGTLSGLDLKVGGEGMRGFYDKILPAFLNKYAKKWGAKVEQSSVPANKEGWHITPPNQTVHGKWMVKSSDYNSVGLRFDTEAEARAALAEKLAAERRPAHSIAITPAMRESVMQGQPLFQKSSDVLRGKIALGSERAIITLFKNADQSTLLHETGHLYLQQLAKDAAHEAAPAQLKQDMQAVLDWLGVKSADDFGTPQHEQFAQGFEQYLREGRAPSQALATAFENFKKWLIEIYKAVTGLGTPISDDIRSVMDRLVATEGEIQAKANLDAGGAPIVPGGGGSAGGAQITNRTDAKLKSALGAERALRQTSPGLRAATSHDVETRRVAQDLVETPFIYEENALGNAPQPAVETLIKTHQAPLAQSIQDLDGLYVQYRTGATGGRLKRLSVQASDALSRSARDWLTFDEFRDEIGKAMRRNDAHAVPEVASAAKRFRELVFNPLKDAAIENGLLPKDVAVETADSYLSRLWNTRKIVANRPDFINRTVKWLKSGQAAAGALGDEASQQFSRLSEGELQDIAEQIITTLIGTPGGRLPYNAIPVSLKTAPALKERTFNIPDTWVEDYLESDVERIAQFYTRTMSSDVELARRFVTPDMNEQIRKIQDSYARKSLAAKTDKERIALDKQRRADIRDISAMRDRLRGTYAAPSDPDSILSRVVHQVKNWNYLRLMGGMVISSFSDAARPVMAEGVTRTIGAGLLPMIRSLKAFRISAGEVQKAGTALDMVLGSRANSIADIGDDFGRHTKFERGMDAAANLYGTAALMNPWNTAMKQFTGVLVQDRILTDVAKVADGTISPHSLEMLAASRIDRNMAERIADQFSKYGETRGGTKIANTDLWDDKQALTVYRSAIVHDVDNAIVTPGVGDRPLVASKLLGSPELAQMVFQFRAFTFASMQRVLISGLQRRDAATLNGLILSVSLGALTYYVKSLQAGIEPSDDPAVWISEGVDRSGVTSSLYDINNIVEKLTAGRVGINAIRGGPPMSRYASRSIVSALLGPSIGTMTDVAQSTAGAFSGNATEADKRAMLRLIPAQNLFYLRSLLDKAAQDDTPR